MKNRHFFTFLTLLFNRIALAGGDGPGGGFSGGSGSGSGVAAGAYSMLDQIAANRYPCLALLAAMTLISVVKMRRQKAKASA